MMRRFHLACLKRGVYLHHVSPHHGFTSAHTMDDIDEILKKHDGRRLARRPDALGSLPVETTAAGIRALARSRWVQAVFEDQPIHLYH